MGELVTVHRLGEPAAPLPSVASDKIWHRPAVARHAAQLASAAPSATRCRLTPLGAVLIVTALTFPLSRWADWDIYWHLANGRLMVESGTFPDPDRFSWAMEGHPYLAYSAQLDRLLYLLWKLGGAEALSVFAVVAYLLVLLPVALLIGRLVLRPPVEAAVLAIVIIAILPFTGARPHLIAAALSGFIVMLLDHPFGLRKAVIAGGTLGLWANIHGSFLVGFALVGAGVVTWLAGRLVRDAGWAGLALALGFGLSLLSPYGIGLWRAPFATVTNPLLPQVNMDWTSLRPMQLNMAAMGLLIAAAVATGIWRHRSPRALAATGLILPTIQIARLTPFTAPLLALVILERLVERVPRLRLRDTSRAWPVATSWQMHAVSWAILITGAAFICLFRPGFPASPEAAAMVPVPHAAMDQLLACSEPGPVWNDFNWGGYLLWRGGGQYTVGIDGRLETLYPSDYFQNYLTVLFAQEGWRDIVQRSPAHYALVYADSPALFETLEGWRLVYADGLAKVLVRDGAAWHC